MTADKDGREIATDQEAAPAFGTGEEGGEDMDVEDVRELLRQRSTRPIWLGVVACLLLAVPIVWTVWQSRMTREALDRAAAAEQAASRARDAVEQARAELLGGGRPAKDPAVRRSRHESPAEIERVRQLHKEIEALTDFQDHVDKTLRAEPPFVPKTAPKPKP